MRHTPSSALGAQDMPVRCPALESQTHVYAGATWRVYTMCNAVGRLMVGVSLPPTSDPAFASNAAFSLRKHMGAGEMPAGEM